MFAHSSDASRTSLIALSLLGFAVLTGCPSKSNPAPDTHAAESSRRDASVTSAAPAPAPAVSVAPAAPSNPKACSVVGSGISIAKGARSDTGATPARLSDGRIVIGYAVGTNPRASVVDLGAQTATAVDVDASALTKDLGPVDKGSTLFLHRVTPFGAAELKMRVLVDASVTAQDKSKRVRCGFSDADRIVGTTPPNPMAGVNVEEIRSCRSFTDGKNVWALSSSDTTARNSGEPTSQWAFHLVGNDGAATKTILGTRKVPDATLERYNFDLPASVHEGDAGYVFAGRFNGNLALTRQAEGSDAASELSLLWLKAALGMPAVAAADRSVTVIAPIAGKPDLYGVTFPIEAEAPKPALLDVETGAGERTSLSLLRNGADSVLAFVEAKGDAKSVKLVVLDAALKPRTPVLDIPGNGKAAAVKLLALEEGRVLAVIVDGGEITAKTIAYPLP
ncbi:hypothetical protein LZC95_46535 [Pendulispora brunnea]|uniref:Uncharacterized protein n=1 Tax=Pendulispora brunnea TaxID=2905690 RepID=A0ABZ2K5C4_9BACT